MALGHDARLMPAQYVKPFLKGHKNDYCDAEACAEAVQRPTMRFVAAKTETTFPAEVCESVNNAMEDRSSRRNRELRIPSAHRGFPAN